MRPSSFKKGGGFLDGVTVLWKDYQWTDEFNGEPFKPGKIKGSDGKMVERPHSLNFFCTFRVEGADEDTTTTLRAAGNFEDYEVSDDGHTLTAAGGGECNIGAKSATGKFLQSLVAAGFPESNFDDDPDSIDVSPALGSRLALKQEVDVERTKKFGQKESKDGKKHDRKDLVVADVLSLPEEGGKSSKTTAKGKGKAAEAEEPEFDLDAASAETLKDILKGEKDEKIQKNKLSVKVLTKLSKGPYKEYREEIRKRIFDDDFLATEDGWEFNKAKGMIVLNE